MSEMNASSRGWSAMCGHQNSVSVTAVFCSNATGFEDATHSHTRPH